MAMQSMASLEPQSVTAPSRGASLPTMTTHLGSRAMISITSTVRLGSVDGGLLAWAVATGWLM